jgi:hypothetical protein
MPPKTLKDALRDWSDSHYAQMEIAKCLGLMDANTSYQTRAKHVFWTNNPIGTMLNDFLQRLVHLEIVERRDSENFDDEYRWNQAFKGSWE